MDRGRDPIQQVRETKSCNLFKTNKSNLRQDMLSTCTLAELWREVASGGVCFSVFVAMMSASEHSEGRFDQVLGLCSQWVLFHV